MGTNKAKYVCMYLYMYILMYAAVYAFNNTLTNRECLKYSIRIFSILQELFTWFLT